MADHVSWGAAYEYHRQHDNIFTIQPLHATIKQQAKWSFLAKSEPDRTIEMQTAVANQPPPNGTTKLRSETLNTVHDLEHPKEINRKQ